MHEPAILCTVRSNYESQARIPSICMPSKRGVPREVFKPEFYQSVASISSLLSGDIHPSTNIGGISSLSSVDIVVY